jgi:hypothetical protein
MAQRSRRAICLTALVGDGQHCAVEQRKATHILRKVNAPWLV